MTAWLQMDSPSRRELFLDASQLHTPTPRKRYVPLTLRNPAQKILRHPQPARHHTNLPLLLSLSASPSPLFSLTGIHSLSSRQHVSLLQDVLTIYECRERFSFSSLFR